MWCVDDRAAEADWQALWWLPGQGERHARRTAKGTAQQHPETFQPEQEVQWREGSTGSSDLRDGDYLSVLYTVLLLDGELLPEHCHSDDLTPRIPVFIFSAGSVAEILGQDMLISCSLIPYWP